MFEHKYQKIVPTIIFIKRLAGYTAVAIALILLSLSIGIAGYHWLAGFSWIDSLLNASMILGGMGPVNLLPNAVSKVFASLYALFSGLVFIAVMGIIFAPIIHRMLHSFHIDDKDLHK